MLTIWGRASSINVMKVLWTCSEIDVAYERIDAGREFGNISHPDFLGMNPNGRVPVLNDDGFILWESNPIIRYLSYKYALSRLYPTDVRQRALAEQWMDWQQTSIAPALAWPFQALVRGDPAYQDEARVAQAAAELNRLWGLLDAHLAERRFVLGEQFSMADIPLGAALWRWTNMALPRRRLPHLTAWQARLRSREGFLQHVMQAPS